MILLVAFAFVAGVITVLSPCILPLLPIILSSSLAGKDLGKARPMGVVVGFVLSFTFFTLFLSTIVRLSGIPADTLRILSIVVIGLFGISFLIPQVQVWIEQLFTKLMRFAPRTNLNPGFGSGLLVGLSLGLLWTPCVGPILASVISLAITGTVTLDAFLITLAYSLGTAIPMFFIMIGGQNALKKVPWLVGNTANIQKGFGVLMVLTAIGIFFGVDRRFQTFILNTFPNYGVGLTRFEDNPTVRKELEGNTIKPIDESMLGKNMDLKLPRGPVAPELIPGGEWFNLPGGSKDLKLADLKSKVVIVDFWTYSCINCQRTLPYLKSWWDKYHDKGLVIVGVHSPEFEFEKNSMNVRKAISDFGLLYPIVQDNDFATWRAYQNHFWPAKYFIDKDGYVRYSHFGEGAYDESEKVIQQLLMEAGNEVGGTVDNPEYQVYSKTPETYLGSKRAEPNNYLRMDGNWITMEEFASPSKGASLTLDFDAKEVFLVMRSKQGQAKVKVYVDGKLESFGEDNKNGVVTVSEDRLYKLVNLLEPGKHTLKLEFEDGNAELFAFTFG